MTIEDKEPVRYLTKGMKKRQEIQDRINKKKAVMAKYDVSDSVRPQPSECTASLK